MEIQIKSGHRVLVDELDSVILENNTFYVTKLGYPQTSKGKTLHRMIMNTPKGMDTDHINRDKLDNRRSNLRIVTRRDNMLNCKLSKNNKSGFNGVSWSNIDKKWRAYGYKNYRYLSLGYFKDLKDAVAARQYWEKHGE